MHTPCQMPEISSTSNIVTKGTARTETGTMGTKKYKLYRVQSNPPNPPSSLILGTFGQHQSPCQQHWELMYYAFRAKLADKARPLSEWWMSWTPHCDRSYTPSGSLSTGPLSPVVAQYLSTKHDWSACITSQPCATWIQTSSWPPTRTRRFCGTIDCQRKS